MDILTRKITIRLAGRSVVLVKRGNESAEHVLMKALLAGLYVPAYPDLRIETRYDREQRYKPDLLATDLQGDVIFWGECGDVSKEKLRTLLKRYHSTHFAFAKWSVPPDPIAALIERALPRRRSAPVDLIVFPSDAARHLAPDGTIEITFADVTWRRWEG